MKLAVTGPRVLIRRSLCAFLSGIQGVDTVIELDSSFHGSEQLRKSSPDILVIDAVDPRSDFELLSQVRILVPHAKAIILVDEPAEDYQLQAIRQGACGFISTGCPPDAFERALKSVIKGQIWIGHDLATRIVDKYLRHEAENHHGQPELSRREQETLALLAEGYRNKEIAGILGVTDSTVRAHVTSVYKKLHLTSRIDAALYHFGRGKNGATRPIPASQIRPLLETPRNGHASGYPLQHLAGTEGTS